MKRCLIVSLDEAAVPFIDTVQTLGLDCAYLDFCQRTTQFLREHQVRAQIIQVGPHKADVVNHPAIAEFDTAVVFEGNWVESALIVQALKQAGLPKVVVVAQHQSFMRAYRALGADRVVGVKRWSRDTMRVLTGPAKRGA